MAAVNAVERNWTANENFMMLSSDGYVAVLLLIVAVEMKEASKLSDGSKSRFVREGESTREVPRIIPPTLLIPPPQLSQSKCYTLCPHFTSSPPSKRIKLTPRNLSLVKNLIPPGVKFEVLPSFVRLPPSSTTMLSPTT